MVKYVRGKNADGHILTYRILCRKLALVKILEEVVINFLDQNVMKIYARNWHW